MSDDPVGGMLLAGAFIMFGGGLAGLAAESLGLVTEAQLLDAASVVGLCIGLAILTLGVYGFGVEVREVSADE